MVEVAGASQPGPRCRIELEGGGELSAAPPVCPRASGDRLVLPARARHGDLGPDWPTPSSRVRSKVHVYSDQGLVAGSEPRLDRGYWTWVAAQRQRAWEMSRGDAALGLVVASALGQKTALPPGDRDALRAAGLGHLIAVSGLHVGVAALLLYALTLRAAWLVGASPRVAVVLSWMPLVAYVGLTGFAASAVRAATMLLLVGLGHATGRPAHGVASLAFTGVAMLTYDPQWALDPGFGLSMAAMAAIVTAPPSSGVLRQSWRVSWAVAPLSWWYFGQASAYGLLGNLVAIPVLAMWVLPTAVLGWGLTPWLGVDALYPARVGARLLLDLAHVLAVLPRPSAPAVAAVAGIAVLGFVVTRSMPRRAFSRWTTRLGLVPPLLTSVGLLLAVWARSEPDPPRTWFALGGQRSMSIIAPDRRGRHVCIREPRWTPALWSRLLPALRIERVGAVVASSDDPAARALREDLAARGLLDGDGDDCVHVDVERAHALLTRCLRRRGARRGIVRGEPDAATVHCFAAGRWRLLASEAR